MLGVFVRPKIFLYDSASGSIKQIRFWGLVPLGAKLTVKTAKYDPDRADWSVGTPAAFITPIATGQILVFRSQDFRGAVRIHKLKTDPYEIGYDVYDEAAGKWGMPKQATEQMPIEMDSQHALFWSVASQNEVYLHADNYTETPSNLLYAVLYPVQENAAVQFVSGQTNLTNWFRFPWDAANP
jgi:hypothetical protein